MKLSTMNRVLAAVLALGMTAALAGCGSTASSEATAESAATEETVESSATEETAEADESAYDYLADFSFSQAYDDNGYLKDVTALDYVTLPDDYADDITIDADLGQVTDEDISNYIDQNVLSNYATDEKSLTAPLLTETLSTSTMLVPSTAWSLTAAIPRATALT